MNRCLFIFLFLMYAFGAEASHIVGGGFSYRHLSGDTYWVELELYRDCSPASAGYNADPLIVGIYSRETNARLDTIQFFTDTTYKIDLGNTNCVGSGSVLCLQKRVYHGVMTLDATTYNNLLGYYLSWELCCRNYMVKNVFQSDKTGMVYYMEIPSPYPGGTPQRIQNSSPVFHNDPKSFICLNRDFEFDFDVRDADGDSLVFSLVTPLKGFTSSVNTNNDNTFSQAGPYPDITWASGYSLQNNVMDGQPDLQILGNKGVIRVHPTKIGLYVFSMLCEEYRNGQKIGEVRRDIQYSVVLCPDASPPALSSNKPDNLLETTVDSRGCVQLFGTDSGMNDSIRIRLISFDSQSNAIEYEFSPVQGKLNIQTEFCLTIPCGEMIRDTVRARFEIMDNACPEPAADTLELKIVVRYPSNMVLEPVLPNVFSPNGDGRNDYFKILEPEEHFCVKNFNISIFNRWGKRIYESGDPAFKWTGDELPAGVYFYVMKYNQYNQSGTITIIR